ncbi:hypothetical protein BaRGS_00015367, partial [Batillaria attramentaria]
LEGDIRRKKKYREGVILPVPLPKQLLPISIPHAQGFGNKINIFRNQHEPLSLSCSARGFQQPLASERGLYSHARVSFPTIRKRYFVTEEGKKRFVPQNSGTSAIAELTAAASLHRLVLIGTLDPNVFMTSALIRFSHMSEVMRS